MKLLRLALAAAIALTCAIQVTSAQTSGESAKKASSHVLQRMAAGHAQDLIVVLDDTGILREASVMQSTALPSETSQSIEYKAARYAEKKREIMSSFAADEAEELKHYSHLPMAFVRIRSRQALDRLLAHPGVVNVYEDRLEHRMLTESLPLIGQPQAAANGDLGAGTTVAVIDTGVDYTRPAFGSCTSPGVPAGCKVVFFQHFESNPVSLDPDGHGTNVAAIVAGVAPGAHIAALDVFDDAKGTALSSDIISAGNWVIANKAVYNIVAMNLSLGSGQHTSPETNGPYNALVKGARTAGILTIASAGNDGYTNALASPAAAQGVVSVGAVYDSSFGGISFPSVPCNDTSAADKIVCFSNSASFLTLLAPGSRITAAGLTMSGTSQAAPHVAGAVAVLRAAFPAETLDQTVLRLANGVQLTDNRNGIVKPRLSLPLAIGLAVACAYVISPASASYNVAGASGSITVTASAGCAWTAASNVSWVSVSSGASGAGNGKITYSVASNPGTSARSGTIIIAGLPFAVTQAGSGVFPSGGVLPAGWAITAGANAGWSVASDYAFEGSSSLKSGPIGNSQKAEIEVTNNFTAGNVSFASKVSSELNFDFLRFYIDGVVQANWSGEQAWQMSSFPLAAGVHTLRWSYEKDVSASNGSDAAWIDAVTLPASSPSIRQALFVNASTSNNKTSVVRIINTTNVPGTVVANAYAESGARLGTTSANLGAIAANQALTFNSAQLESLIGFTPGVGTAKYSINFSANLPSFEVINYTRDSASGNLTLSQTLTSDRSTNAAAASVTRSAWFMSTSTSSNKTNVLRIVNTSAQSGLLSATVYDEAGNLYGNASTSLGTIGALQMKSYTSAEFESAIGFTPGSPTAKYRVVFSANLPSMELINFTKDIATGSLTLVQAQLDDRPAATAAVSSRNVLLVYPSTNVSRYSVIRIINPNATIATVTASVYDGAGNAVVSGGALGRVAPNGILTLSSGQIESLLGYSPSSANANYRLVVNADVPSFEVLQHAKAISTGSLYLSQAQTDNRAAGSATTTTRNAYIVYPSNSDGNTTQLYVVNTTSLSAPLTAKAYDDNGVLVASNKPVGMLGANLMLTLTSAQLETLMGYTPPTPSSKWRIVISANLSNFELINYAKDALTGTSVLAQSQTE